MSKAVTNIRNTFEFRKLLLLNRALQREMIYWKGAVKHIKDRLVEIALLRKTIILGMKNE